MADAELARRVAALEKLFATSPGERCPECGRTLGLVVLAGDEDYCPVCCVPITFDIRAASGGRATNIREES